MRKLSLLLFVGALLLSSCKKEEKEPSTPTTTNTVNVSEDIIGTWNEAQHMINGDDYSQTSLTISFFSNGTYTTNQFTYPWHCEPGASSADSGQWEYNSTTKVLTLTSTKPQEGHPNNVLSSEVTSFTQNEMVIEFVSPSCQSQNVEITFHR